MKLDQLTYFLEAAKHQHLGKAYKALAISASAVSHSISALEAELGKALFEKHGKNIVLTSHGRLLMERASSLLQQVENLKQEISSDSFDLQGHYRLAGTHGLCAKLITHAFSKIQSESPQLVGEILSLRSAQVLQEISEGTCDVGLCFSPQEHPHLEIQRIHTGNLIVGVRQGHPLLQKKTAEALRELSLFPAVLPKAFQGVEICERHAVFAKFRIVPKVDCVIDSYDVMIEKVARSLSWGFFPDVLFASQQHSLVALPLPPEWEAPYHISMVWQRHTHTSGFIKRLLALTKEFVLG